MDQHYSAFISYKHAPADIAVASEIQKKLERYHIPTEIRKKTGRDKIGRIFRDKEELPITSDLSDTISKALEEADYLIVICSSSTKLSTWVPREIDYFLKNHSKKQILTVLVDGEPANVIPEQLLTDTVTKTNPDGTTYEEDVVYEPLSCDFRSGSKEAKRTEIPRLAAALLGCTYDELVRREHQYKRRRNLAIGIPAALALAVAIAYLIWSRQEIAKNYQRAEDNYQKAEENYQIAQEKQKEAQENYQIAQEKQKEAEENYQTAKKNYQEAQENLNQSLINQSDFLSSESRKLLEKGDRIYAILLAMEALPDREADPDSLRAIRPVTVTAKKALEQALHAYTTQRTITESDSITTVAEFSMENSIADYKATSDGRFVIVQDRSGHVGVWDVADFSRIMLLDSIDVYDVQLLSDDQMVLISDAGVISYDLSSGQELWRVSDPDTNWYSSAICLSSERSIVWLSQAYRDVSDSVYYNNMKLLGIEASSGEIVFSTMLLENAEDYVSIQQVICSEDGKWVAAAIKTGGFNNYPVKLFIVNVNAKTCTELSLNKDYYKVDSMAFIKENDDENTDQSHAERLAIMAYPMEFYDKGTQTMLAGGVYFTWVNPMEISISCYDVVSSNLIWENSYSSFQDSSIPEGRSLLFSESAGKLFSLFGNTVTIIHASDGKIVDKLETTSPILSGKLDSGEGLAMFLQSGSIGTDRDDKPGEVVEIPYIDFDIQSFSKIQQYQGEKLTFLVVPDANCVWLCRAVYDDAFIHYTGADIPRDSTFKKEVIAGDTIAILDYDRHLYLYDLSEQSPGEEIDLSDRIEGLGDIIGGDNNAGIVWIDSGDYYHLLMLDVSDGSIQEYDHDMDMIHDPKVLADGTLVYWVYDYSHDYMRELLIAVSVINDSLTRTVISDKFNYTAHYFIRPDLKVAVLGESDSLQLADLTTGEAAVYDNILSEAPKQVVWQESSQDSAKYEEEHPFAVTDGYEVVILKRDGTEIGRITQTESEVINIASYKDELIVLFSGGLLSRYAWGDGTETGSSQISYYKSEHYNDTVEWYFEENYLYLISRGDTPLLHIINLDTWEEEERFQYGIAYDSNRDHIIFDSFDDEEKYVGYFPHYSLEDLLQKAKDALHGAELTEAERKNYGLSD